MGYVLESNAIKYMLEDFPKRLMPDKWETFQESCHKGISITDRETLKELELMVAEAESLDWIDNNKKFFIAINEKDANALGELMTQGIFNFYIGSPEFKRKLPVASPFLVAMAKSKKKNVCIT